LPYRERTGLEGIELTRNWRRNEKCLGRCRTPHRVRQKRGTPPPAFFTGLTRSGKENACRIILLTVEAVSKCCDPAHGPRSYPKKTEAPGMCPLTRGVRRRTSRGRCLPASESSGFTTTLLSDRPSKTLDLQEHLHPEIRDRSARCISGGTRGFCHALWDSTGRLMTGGSQTSTGGISGISEIQTGSHPPPPRRPPGTEHHLL